VKSSAARAALRSTRLLLHLFRANQSWDTGARPLWHPPRYRVEQTRRSRALGQALLARNRCRSSLVLRSAARAALDLRNTTTTQPSTWPPWCDPVP